MSDVLSHRILLRTQLEDLEVVDGVYFWDSKRCIEIDILFFGLFDFLDIFHMILTLQFDLDSFWVLEKELIELGVDHFRSHSFQGLNKSIFGIKIEVVVTQTAPISGMFLSQAHPYLHKILNLCSLDVFNFLLEEHFSVFFFHGL